MKSVTPEHVADVERSVVYVIQTLIRGRQEAACQYASTTGNGGFHQRVGPRTWLLSARTDSFTDQTRVDGPRERQHDQIALCGGIDT